MQIKSFYPTPKNQEHWCQWASWILAGFSMWAILNFHLLSALLAGLAVHQLTIRGATRLHMISGGKMISGSKARGVLVVALSVVIITLLVGAGLGISAFFHSQGASINDLLDKVNNALQAARGHLPNSLKAIVPSDINDLKSVAASKMHTHAAELQGAGRAALTNMAHILVGLILGAMVALSEIKSDHDQKPLAKAFSQRVKNLSLVFGQIVSAQLKISLLNTTLTALFLFAVLPLLGAPIPLTKTLIILTFMLGLLPVIGNLMSNTLVVLVSLSVAPWVAGVSLVFLILIHKLEYFLNAKIVGGEIKAKSWELLLAMLVMEALFGLPGVVAAPIFYAWIKRELGNQGLV